MSNDPHVPPNISFDEDGNVRRSAELEALICRHCYSDAYAAINREAASIEECRQPVFELTLEQLRKPLGTCRNCGREIVDESGCAW